MKASDLNDICMKNTVQYTLDVNMLGHNSPKMHSDWAVPVHLKFYIALFSGAENKKTRVHKVGQVTL